MNRQRLFECMEKSGLDYLLLDSLENVSYVSGMGIPVPYGAMFAYGGGMPLGYGIVSAKEQQVWLIVSDSYKEYAEHASADRIYLFSHYDHFRKRNGDENLKLLLERLLDVPAGKRIGIEFHSCPALVYQILAEKGFFIQEAEPVVRYTRKVKTAEELEKIRASVAIEDCGQNRLLQYAREFNGETDFEMWSGITQAMNEKAGKVARIVGELATGKNAEIRTGLGGPDGSRVNPGDMGRMDISIRYHGYWCDCTNTVVFGRKPNEQQMEYFKIVEEAYEAAKSKLYPGNALCDPVKAEAQVYEKYEMKTQVYTGHQIGCGVNEPGRIVCYEDEIIVPGMVVCIEPQQYGPEESGIGVRLEKVIEITDKGPVELNQFCWGHLT